MHTGLNTTHFDVCLNSFQNETTPLDEYVWRDDGAFTWEEKGSYRYNGVTVYFVNMTSQIWMDGMDTLINIHVNLNIMISTKSRSMFVIIC